MPPEIEVVSRPLDAAAGGVLCLPSDEQLPGLRPVTSRREVLRRCLDSLVWQLLILGAASIDIVALVLRPGRRSAESLAPEAVAVALYLVDIALRMFVYRRIFFRSPWSWLDTAVTAGSTTLFVIHVAVAATNVALGEALHGIRAARAALKLANVARISCDRSKTLARHLVGQNKRRLVDLELEIDLNLTYTPA